MSGACVNVINGCILMTHESCQRRSKGRTSKSRAGFAPAVRATSRGRRAPGQRLLPLSTTGISLPSAGTSAEGTRSGNRIEAGIHGKATARFDSAGAVVCICQTTLDQRGGQPRVTRAAATRARSWLRQDRFPHVPFSWSIVSTVCCPTSWPRSFSPWCRINAGQSQLQYPTAHHKLRR
jgi:hypothetical protein